VLNLALYPTVAAAATMDNDEFVGPFASWTNIKIAYGAMGDGITDDTATFQQPRDASRRSIFQRATPLFVSGATITQRPT
jgi:hypothetical protein